MLELPTPKLVCFYNGIANKEDISYLRLSDSFKNNTGKTDGTSDIEVTVKMININNGRNEKLLNSCRPLKDYAMFVEHVRKYGAIYDVDSDIENEKLAEAINNAIDSLPDDSEIKSILESRRAEVVKLCIEEYTKEHSDYVRKIEDDKKNEKINKLDEKINELDGKIGELEKDIETKDKIIEEKEKQIENTEKNLQKVLENLRAKGMSEEEIQKLLGN